MPYPVRSGFSKRIDGILDVQAQAVDEVAYDEIAGSVESVVAVNANIVLFPPFNLSSGLLVLSNAVNLLMISLHASNNKTQRRGSDYLLC